MTDFLFYSCAAVMALLIWRALVAWLALRARPDTSTRFDTAMRNALERMERMND